jgi:hypothetical protein
VPGRVASLGDISGLVCKHEANLPYGAWCDRLPCRRDLRGGSSSYRALRPLRSLSYTLAGVHLLMTLLTDFPAGIIKVIPIALHQWVERIVGPLIIILALIAMTETPARAFFVAMGVIIFAVERLTAYRPMAAAK